jgi:hypothetical protein
LYLVIISGSELKGPVRRHVDGNDRALMEVGLKAERTQFEKPSNCNQLATLSPTRDA